MNQKNYKLVFGAVMSLVLVSCSNDAEPLEDVSTPQSDQDVVDFLDDEKQDQVIDELDQNTIIDSKVNAPVDFKDWTSEVEMSTLIVNKDGYSLEMPADLVSYDWESTNKLLLSQNISVTSPIYQSDSTNNNHWISVVRGDAGIVETKEMVYKQQMQLAELAEEKQISVEELVIIHDFKEFDNKYGQNFQYTMIETMSYSEEFPTSLILILAQEEGHLYFDASYEDDAQKESLKTYLLELCYHISPDNGSFRLDDARGASIFYQVDEDGSRESVEFNSGDWVNAGAFT